MMLWAQRVWCRWVHRQITLPVRGEYICLVCHCSFRSPF